MRRIYLIVFCVLVSACGFHLRGNFAISAQQQPLYIDVPASFADFSRELQETLVNAKIRRTQNPVIAKTRIKIAYAGSTRSLASLGSNTQLRYYTLSYAIHYQRLDKHLRPLGDVQTVSSLRQYTENPNQLLGSGAESKTLESELQQEVVASFLREIGNYAGNQ